MKCTAWLANASEACRRASAAGRGQAYQIDGPRQSARAQRVDLTRGPVDLEGLELRYPSCAGLAVRESTVRRVSFRSSHSMPQRAVSGNYLGGWGMSKSDAGVRRE